MRPLITVLVFLTITLTVQSKTIQIQSFEGDTNLPHAVLTKALNNAGLDFDYLYKEQEVAGSRIFNDVKTGELDVMWTMASKTMEQDYAAVHFPIYKGLLGMRLGIVKREKSDLFRNVYTLDDLQRFVAGQGKTWPDTTILEHNRLNVAKTLKYPNLFYMLEGERFDYFPRGIYEPWGEVERFADLNLVVEPHLIIRYQAPLYFFLNKNNTQLVQTITSELHKMLDDGTYDKMFCADERVKSALALANVKQRRIIDLQNPLLSDNTPIGNKKLWFDPLTYND